MRFLISLHREGRESFLPINYQYELSSVIYKTIDKADSGFSKFLHEQGYLAFGRKFRLFTFSRIDFKGFRIVRDAGRIEHYGKLANIEISFLVDRAAEEFIKGLFMDQSLLFGDKISKVSYTVSGISSLQPPVYSDHMRYRCLSPIFLRRKRKDGGEDFLHPHDEDYGPILVQNLLAKASAFKNTECVPQAGESLPVPDFSFQSNEKIYKNGVKIKQRTDQETHLVGYMYEFEFRAPAELQEIGYTAGFGHLGSQGFGCVEVKG